MRRSIAIALLVSGGLLALTACDTPAKGNAERRTADLPRTAAPEEHSRAGAARLDKLPTGRVAVRDDANPLQPGEQRVRPAVLILRAWEGRGGQRHWESVEPPGLRQLPYRLHATGDDPNAPAPNDAPEDLRFKRNGDPELGPGYELARTYIPDDSSVRYYIYNIDVSNPGVARNWRELAKAQRAERREAQAQLEGDREWVRRGRRVLTAAEQALEEGVVLMQAGEYRGALVSLTRSSELNHGDPACRIHLALVRAALGHDVEATRVLRKALELQPKLVPMQLGIVRYFPSGAEFADVVNGLTRRLETGETPAEAWFLLGFLHFQSERFDDAHRAFARAALALPKDERTRKYLELTAPARR